MSQKNYQVFTVPILKRSMVACHQKWRLSISLQCALSQPHSTVVVAKSPAELMQKKGDFGAGSGLCELANQGRLGVSGGEA